MATNATKVVAQNQATADLIFNLAKKEGFSDIQATALVANSIQESSLNPGIKNFNPSSKDDSVGLFQLNFNGGMGVDFANAKGISIAEAKVLATNPTENASFIIAAAKRKGFGDTRTAEEANRFLVKRVIRPGDQENEIRKRTAIHRQVEAELVRDPRAFGVNESSVARNSNDPDNFSDENVKSRAGTSRTSQGDKTTTEELPEIEVIGVPEPGAGGQVADDDAQDEEQSPVNLDQFSEAKITPKPNILSDLVTQTYKFTIFLQTKEQYKDMVLDPDGNKDTSQLMKIVESGGTGGESNGATSFSSTSSTDADGSVSVQGTSTFTSSPFKLDYYIDNIELECVLSKKTGGPSNITKLRFDIIEPFGFRFFEELRQACDMLDMVDYAKQHYLMVIEFRGEYDSGISLNQKPGFSRVGGIDQKDQNQLAEKYIPFFFNTITTTLDDGAAKYHCEGTPSTEMGKLQKFQEIPYNLEITGATLDDIFGEGDGAKIVTRRELSAEARESQTKAQKTVANNRTSRGNSLATSSKIAGRITTIQNFQNDPKVDLSAKTAGKGALGFETTTYIQSGIVNALNKFNREKLQEKGIIQHPDIFKVTFLDGIGNAKLSVDSWVKTHRNKKYYPFFDNADNGNNEHSAPEKGQINKTSQIHTIQANTKLIKMLEQCIRSSTFITDQSVKKVHPNTKNSKDNTSASGKPLVWFQITTRIIPYAYDEIRGCSAYEVEYLVNAKQVADAKSDFFLKEKYVGPHKKYDYWFTGKNTEVLDYKQTINAAWFAIVTGMAPGVSQAELKNSQSLTAKQFKAESTESQQQGGTNAIPGADAAGNLYSPSDYQSANMTILGDPDYIIQTEIFYSTADVGQPGAFIEQDGSINVTGGDVLFELNFKTMSDYNHETGLADVQNLVVKSDAEVEATGTSGLIYQVNRYNCIFKGGVFTISLEDNTIREYADTIIKNEQIKKSANLLPGASAKNPERVSRVDNTGSLLLQSRPGAAEKAAAARGLGKKQSGGSQGRITASNNVIPLANATVDGKKAKTLSKLATGSSKIRVPQFLASASINTLGSKEIEEDDFTNEFLNDDRGQAIGPGVSEQ
jgi:hypothetical protein